jgi:hypothetical protein
MLRNLGNMEGTKWELYGNTMAIEKSKKPTPPTPDKSSPIKSGGYLPVCFMKPSGSLRFLK